MQLRPIGFVIEILSNVVDEAWSGGGVLLVDEVLGGSLLSFL